MKPDKCGLVVKNVCVPISVNLSTVAFHGMQGVLLLYLGVLSFHWHYVTLDRVIKR
jgi:hypothetical protein